MSIIGASYWRTPARPSRARWQALLAIIGSLPLALSLASSVSVAAQAAPPVHCGVAGGGSIRGVVVDDSTGVPVADAYIYLFVRDYCTTKTDGLGRFVVHSLPLGSQRIETGGPGYRQFQPISVDVLAVDTTLIELRLVPGGPLEDCRASPSCSPLTEGGLDVLSDEDAAFRLAALGTAIALAWPTVGGDERWYACVQDEQQAVTMALRERYRPVVDGVECDDPADRPLPQMRHISTGRPAFQPRVNRVVEIIPGRRTVSLSYYVGARWGARWDCDFEMTERGWRPTLCIAIGVS
jgi:hypothetical protein